jgi:Flp pilus assembly protein TadG
MPLQKGRNTMARFHSEKGQTILAFSVALPILAVMLIGIIFGGITFYDDVMLANAVVVGATALGNGQGDVTVCTDANTALTNAAYGLTASQITIATPTFTTASGAAGNSSCDVTSGTYQGTSCSAGSPCQVLVTGEFATISADYPCSLSFPKLGINLCPVTGGTGACPSAYCITSKATVRIE